MYILQGCEASNSVGLGTGSGTCWNWNYFFELDPEQVSRFHLSVEMERNWKIVLIYYLEMELEVFHYKERTCPTPV